MKTKLLLLVVLLGALVAAPACYTAEEESGTDGMTVLEGSGDHQVTQLPIYNGYAPDAPEHKAVVSLHMLTADRRSVYVDPFCTGTLVSSRVVLTAAHCLDTAAWGSKFKTMPASRLAIYVGNDPYQDILSHLYLVSENSINSSYKRTTIRNDIAAVRLSRAVTEAVTPVKNLPRTKGFTNADIGTYLNFAGFGDTETGDFGVKMQVDVKLAGYGCVVSGCTNGGDAATQISYSQTQAGPCFGDSGGPAFVYRSGTPYVGGITSYGDSYCTRYGVSTRVDAFETWVNNFVNR